MKATLMGSVAVPLQFHHRARRAWLWARPLSLTGFHDVRAMSANSLRSAHSARLAAWPTEAAVTHEIFLGKSGDAFLTAGLTFGILGTFGASNAEISAFREGPAMAAPVSNPRHHRIPFWAVPAIGTVAVTGASIVLVFSQSAPPIR